MYTQQMYTQQTGFTLIELMIVVAIIGIMVGFAVPAYQNYIVRTQVTEGLILASEAKASISDFFAARGRLPASNLSAGMAAAGSLTGNYVSQIDVVGGTITITYGNKVSDKIVGAHISIVPYVSAAGSIVWSCGNATPPAGTTPITSPVPAGPGLTDINMVYVPGACRP